MGMRGLQGKTAIVTGGAHGIGEATAVRLAEEGVQVAIADLDLEAATPVAERIKASGGTAVARQIDVSDETQCEELCRFVVDTFGVLQILVNNAGSEARDRSGTPTERWDKGIRLSLSSMYRMSEAALPHLLANESSAIVNLSSVVGTKTYGMAEWYGAAKAGITGLTRAQAGMHGKAGLRSNAVCPGTIRTRRTVTIWDDEDKSRRFLKHSAIQRLGEPEDVAGVIAFLVSDDAAYVTGEAITIDGGWGLN